VRAIDGTVPLFELPRNSGYDVGMIDHVHQWRATTKVFALVCECGTAYHEWLLTEIERLKVAASTPPEPLEPFITQDDVDRVRSTMQEEIDQLRAGSQVELERLSTALTAVQTENAALRAEIEEARRELEVQAEEVAGALTSV